MMPGMKCANCGEPRPNPLPEVPWTCKCGHVITSQLLSESVSHEHPSFPEQWNDELMEAAAKSDEPIPAPAGSVAHAYFPKTVSMQEQYEQLLPLTRTLRLIQHEPASSCVHEYEDTRGDRHVVLIKYAGVMVGHERGDDLGALARLMQLVDEAILYGDHFNPEMQHGVHGLLGFVNEERVKRYDSSPEFYERVYEERKAGNAMRVHMAPCPDFVTEGDLPPGGRMVFAFRPDALVWRQLMPPVIMPLVPIREGKLVVSLVDSRKPVEFKHEDSTTYERGVVLMYGGLELHDPDGVFALVHE